MFGIFKEMKDGHKTWGGGTETINFDKTEKEILELKKYNHKNFKLSGQV